MAENRFKVHSSFILLVHLLYEDVIESHLFLSDLHDLLFHATSCHYLEDQHLVFLPNAMSTGERLNVLMRIEVRIHDNDRVGGGKVDTNASSSCREQEGKVRRVWCVKLINPLLFFKRVNTTVESTVLQAQPVKEIFDNVQVVQE